MGIQVLPGVAGGGFVSVSAAQVYNAADFVCALLHCRSAGERFSQPDARRCLSWTDEDHMKKLLLAGVALLMTVQAQAAQDPETVYNRSCASCHNGQMPIAARKGDTVAWQRLLEKGMDTLVAHTMNGYNAMPPRGMCMDCSAEDYKAVIEWLSK